MYTDFVLYTLPVRSPKISSEFLKKLSIDSQESMDCDEDDDDEDPDFVVNL